ncbi:MAG: phosphonate utilization associated transcriptional regulator [Betaproteobacteria bacterium]|nr:phosphonate utilization associated transcriptional regulator [Betaproteobacteria bacterium]
MFPPPPSRPLRVARKQPSPRTLHSAEIELLQQHSLTSLVQRELERQIVSGELASGAKLNEADIAGELRVSRGPVREAFRALEQAGLVRLEKNRGVFVRQVSLEEANEIYEVRAALDGLIGRLAARRIRPEQLARVRAIVKRMHAVGRARDADAYFPLNLEFHEVLAEAAGNRALRANYRRVVNELDLFRRETLVRNAQNIPISTRDHEAILNAVVKGDSALAERLLFEHVINSRERLHLALKNPPARAPRSARKAA